MGARKVKGERGGQYTCIFFQKHVCSDYNDIQGSVADLPEPNPALGQDLSGEKWSISAEDEEHTNTVQSQLTSN